MGVGEAASAEEITQQSVSWEEPAYGRYEKKYTHTQREREAQRGISYYQNATVTIMNNQPLQKVTKSLYIVTHLGQLPFMLIIEMARTWAIKEDSVNTSIIHWYSTLHPLVDDLSNRHQVLRDCRNM